jgi:UPF0755 protein
MVVANNLVTAGILRDTQGFIFASYLKGAHKKIKAGEYELSPAMAPAEILDILVEGRIKYYTVRVPEGSNLREIAAAVEKAGLAAEKDFLNKVENRAFIASLGFPDETLEGYLFPDTYYFRKNAAVEEIIIKMADRFKKIYEEQFAETARSRRMTMKAVVTLASIIEKESSNPLEMPLVSAVFHNRLRIGMPLQSDPTVIYGLGDFKGALTRAHLKKFSLYNTYLRHGLPPSPIASPGKTALRAALNPVDVDYLYFVSRNDGTHEFSRTLEEHNRAVWIYQKNALTDK